MHGLFQNLSAVNALLSYLSQKKGEHYRPVIERKSDPYDELAEIFETYVDMDAIVSLTVTNENSV